MHSGHAALHRVSTVLAHQRMDVDALTLTRLPDGQSADLVLELVDVTPEKLEQLIKRLRRQVVVLHVAMRE